MADVQKKSPVKKATKPKKPSKPADHPSFKVMVKAAVKSLKERNGSSRQAIKKYIAANYKGVNMEDSGARFVSKAIKKLVEEKVLVQTKGSFKLSAAAKEEKKPKKVVKKAKKPKATTKKVAAKKPKAKKPAKKEKSDKKPKAKKPKTPKKASKAKKTPKKATKPKAAKLKSAKKAKK